jgi:hypothetical protein
MLFRTFVRVMASVFCLGQCVAGCGRLGEETPDHLDFALPKSLSFTVRSNQQPLPPTGIPNVVCAGPEALIADCCSPPAPAPSVDCQIYPLGCDPVDNFCAMIFDVEQSVDVRLMDVQEIAAVQGRIFSSVSLISLTTEISDAYELPIRSASLFVAPVDASGTASPGALFLASVSLKPGENPIVLDAAGQQAFSSFATDYETPFSIVLSAQLVIKGDTFPSGSVGVTVTGQAEALY